MQINNSTGTNAVLINMKFGVKLIGIALLLGILTGCQRHTLIDILNESGNEIQVLDYSSGHPVAKTLNNHTRVDVLSPVPLIILDHGQERRYYIESIPKAFIQSEFRGRLISVELGVDKNLYLLNFTDKPPSKRFVPQPAPFPIIPAK